MSTLNHKGLEEKPVANFAGNQLSHAVKITFEEFELEPRLEPGSIG